MDRISMKAYTKDGRLLKNLINAIGGIAPEVTITASPDGLYTRAYDPSHSAMVEFNLPKNLFDEYFCPSNEVFKLDLVEISKLLGGSTQGEPLEVDYSTDTKKIRFTFKNVNTRRFTTGTQTPDKYGPEPKVSFTAKLLVGAKAFKSLIEDAKKVSEEVITLTVEPKRLMTKAASKISSVEVEKPVIEGGEVMSIEAKDTVVSTYNVKFLESIVASASEVSELLTVELANFTPIKVSAMLPAGSLTYYMAPRKEE